MNRNNVWSLADAADEAALRRAIVHVPASINVSGWSYVGGRRRGIARGIDEPWEITDMEGSPAPVLFFATIRQSLPCVILALEHGANVDLCVEGATADLVATEMGPGWETIAEVIQSARKRQHDPIGTLEEEEHKERTLLEARAGDAFHRLESSFESGVVNVTVVLRDSLTTTRHVIPIPRYVSYRTLVQKIEGTVGQRVLLSFKTPKNYSKDALIQTPSPGASTQNSPARRGDLSSGGTMSSKITDPEEAAWLAEKEDRDRPQFLELRPRTTALFLAQAAPECTARPLAFQYAATPTPSSGTAAHPRSNSGATTPQPATSPTADSPSSSPANATASTNQTQQNENQSLIVRVRATQRQAREQGLAPDKRLEKLLKLLQDEETLNGANHSASKLKSSNSRIISREELDSALNRLYDRSLQSIKQRRQSLAEFEAEGQEYLARKPKVTRLGEKEQATVERLYSSAEAKAAAIAKIEEQVQQSLPKPKEHTLTPEELEEMAKRLTGGATQKKEQSLRRVEVQMYGDPELKKVEDMDKHLNSVYFSAVAKKKAAIEKIEQASGDFRSKKKVKKMTAEEIKVMGDRLSKPA